MNCDWAHNLTALLYSDSAGIKDILKNILTGNRLAFET